MITTALLLKRPELRKGAGWRGAVTHCPRGHEYTPENILRNQIGGRECKTCRYAATRARVAAARQGQRESSGQC